MTDVEMKDANAVSADTKKVEEEPQDNFFGKLSCSSYF